MIEITSFLNIEFALCEFGVVYFYIIYKTF